MPNSAPALPRIAITMGDPAGVGPEICLRALASEEIAALCQPIVFGDAGVLAAVARQLELPFSAPVVSTQDWSPRIYESGDALVRDLGGAPIASFTPGTINAITGRASHHYVDRAIDAALLGEVAAITTAPINKEALHLAGIRFPGHTEMLAARTSSPRSCMMQYSEEITCTFVTTHVGYSDVPRLLNIERILDVIDLTVQALRRLGCSDPKLVVCGLNPHAGEHGLFGCGEEERIILPAIEKARASGISIEGPLPPDTAFLPEKRRETDAFICMYHDQGHIPLKALAFDSAVNTTLGLPIIRTSVDHGTALDIAWQGKAKPDSLFAALRLATRLAATASPARS